MSENRFKKSIATATDNTKESIIENTKDNILESRTENIVENTSKNILEKVLQGNKKDKGGNHTIYLSAEVGEVLVKYAKKTGKSKSELIDSILREVFQL